MKHPLPKDKKDTPNDSLRNLFFPAFLLCLGGAGIAVAGYFNDGAVLGISVLVCTFGVYGLGEALLGALMDVSPKLGGFVIIVGFGALAFAFFHGYHLLM